MQKIDEIFRELKDLNILVIGDVMIDRYLRGEVSRVSPEAPVPVVHLRESENRLGGAANVALNIRAMGANPILATVIGSDEDGEIFKGLLPANGLNDELIHSSVDRPTTLKVRVMAGSQQLLRLDQEEVRDLNARETDFLLSSISQLLGEKNIHAILFQDYNKGVLSREVIQSVTGLAKEKGIPTSADPKKDNFWAFIGVDLFKPNLKEIRAMLPFPLFSELSSLDRASRYIRKKLKSRYNLITLSENGIYFDDAGKARILPTTPRSISDVSGAGDTVISIATLGLAAGWELETIAILANLAGGQVCEKPGVVPVDIDQLKEEYRIMTKK